MAKSQGFHKKLLLATYAALNDVKNKETIQDTPQKVWVWSDTLSPFPAKKTSSPQKSQSDAPKKGGISARKAATLFMAGIKQTTIEIK